MTESYVLTLKLNTSPEQDQWLAHVFWCGQQIYNVLVRHCRKQLRKLILDPEYRELLATRRKDNLSKKDKNRINQGLADIRRGYGLSEYQLHAYISVQQHRYQKYIDSMTAQKIASSVWRSVEKYLFDNGKCIETEQQPDYEVSMSIGTLTTLMLGYKTAEKLHVMDKIQASDEAVEHLDDILFHRIPYVSDYI